MTELEVTKQCSQAGKSLFHPTEELRLLCEQCDQPVCRDCAVDRHRQHPYDFTGSVIHRHGHAPRELLRSTQQHTGTPEDALSQTDDTGSAVRSRAEAVATETSVCQWLRESDWRAPGPAAEAAGGLGGAEGKSAALAEGPAAAAAAGPEDRRLLTSGSDLEILITKGAVASRLAKLNSTAYNTHPGVDDGIQFSPQERAGRCCGCEVLGASLDEVVDPARCTLHEEGNGVLYNSGMRTRCSLKSPLFSAPKRCAA